MLSVKKILLLFTLCLCVCSGVSLTNNTRHPRFYELATKNGYKARSYHVITEDDYILRLDRISGGPSSPEARGKPVVFLQHGLLGCSELFVFWDPKDSLAYLLSDAGYDVWVSNSRGNTNSRAHRRISPSSHEFWNFTLDDLATKDLPAMIDFALRETKQPCLTYIGHSMGSTLSYILLSEKPEYNRKISFVVSLAPVVLWRYSTMGLLKSVLNSAIDFMSNTMLAPDYAVELLSHNSQITKIFGSFCNLGGSELCIFLMNSFFGHAGKQAFSANGARRIADYAPAGTSLKVLQHYRQMINSGSFRKFNHGNDGNLRIYNKNRPPSYNVKTITTRVALFWVHNDPLGHEMNVGLLALRLRNLVAVEPVPSLQFGHSDFYFFRDGGDIIHNRIILFVKKYGVCVFNKEKRRNGTRKNGTLQVAPKEILSSLKYDY